VNTDRWGIDEGYEDALGRWHTTPMETRSAILTAMKANSDRCEPAEGSAAQGTSS
jgi:hypothetical protein